MMGKDATRFVVKAVLLGVLFYCVCLLVSLAFSHVVNWRKWQGPRTRLLYEPVAAEDRIILLGDSVWISSYVNREEDTLWKVLEKLTGKRVYNGTLNGADPADFLNAARLLPDRQGDGSVVFLDFVPTRLLARNFAGPTAGNYSGAFSRLVADNLPGRIYVFLRKPLIVLDVDIVMNTLMRKKSFGVGEERYRVWSRDGDYALKRFRTFERRVADTNRLRGMDWVQILADRLSRKGYRLVVVVTPVNSFLIQEYASKDKAGVYQARIARAREAILAFLKGRHIEFVDCGENPDPESFADLIHTNGRGDRFMAERMARYLASTEAGPAGVPAGGREAALASPAPVTPLYPAEDTASSLHR